MSKDMLHFDGSIKDVLILDKNDKQFRLMIGSASDDIGYRIVSISNRKNRF